MTHDIQVIINVCDVTVTDYFSWEELLPAGITLQIMEKPLRVC